MLSIIFGLIASSFAILNISIKPVETINGPMGLYLWNTTAGKYRGGGGYLTSVTNIHNDSCVFS